MIYIIAGIDYYGVCDAAVSGAFWQEFSALLAQASDEFTFFLANGERAGGAFSCKSYFATVEIPHLNAQVTTVVAIIVHREHTGLFSVERDLVTVKHQRKRTSQ